MKFSRSTKFTLLFIALFSLAACSSTSEEASNEVVAETESGIDATTRRTQELEAEARARAAAAEERIAAAALNTESSTSTSTCLNSAKQTAMC